ncbi:riboflavin biosynthesis protein PYRD, chloroplastic [Alnus glutinosa]|uniref:riboflavin biosynthesis protein PYRD, chloroplastic n=1 Tax=Alnus glutinosa TaxID=3517 RepID=UPI002D76512C|nr:riboflavin biosynthesis protein PYRD, chloroplastic [Alnus glutinosa]
MQIQRLSFQNHTLTPPSYSPTPHIFPSFPPTNHSTKLVSHPNSKSGFCNLLKRMSKSPTGVKNRSGLVRVRCGGVTQDNDDGFYMRRCVELARKAIGCTSPNPMVGCVIVKDGKIVGEGFHPKAGQPHAEVFALRDAGDLAENATAYVSLEPCNHYGRTPPCTQALIKAKVKKVVLGMVDPNPIVASKGVDRLRDAGIDVTVGIEEELCKALNEAYIHRMLTGKPFLTLRYSLSVNGNVLDQLGEGVTEPGGYYSQLLQEYDAVILSPSLFIDELSIPASQEPGAKQPFWILTARTPNPPIKIPDLTTEEAAKVIIFTDKEMDVEPETAQQGIEMVVLDRINLKEILEYCARQGFCSVLLDLRGNFGDLKELLKEGIEQNLLQKIVMEVLPVWDGSNSENLLVAMQSLDKRIKVKNLRRRISDNNVVLEAYL